MAPGILSRLPVRVSDLKVHALLFLKLSMKSKKLLLLLCDQMWLTDWKFARFIVLKSVFVYL